MVSDGFSFIGKRSYAHNQIFTIKHKTITILCIEGKGSWNTINIIIIRITILDPLDRVIFAIHMWWLVAVLEPPELHTLVKCLEKEGVKIEQGGKEKINKGNFQWHSFQYYYIVNRDGWWRHLCVSSMPF